MQVMLSGNWGKLAKRYGSAGLSTKVRVAGLIQAAMDEGRLTVIEQLDNLIYMAPAPPSAAGREAAYLASHRTNRTRYAVQRSPRPMTVGNATEGRVFVDRSFYEDAYYAPFLDAGTRKMKARPFMKNSKVIMRQKLRFMGKDLQKGIKQDLKVA